jgi:AraC-like DNA-binding protein
MNTSIDPRVAKVVETVQSSPSVTVSDLANHLGISHSRLGHLFKYGMGMSLASFLEQRRLEKASELLRSTEMRVKEITYLLGYGHGSSFSRAFQRKFRCSPSNYRKLRNS